MLVYMSAKIKKICIILLSYLKFAYSSCLGREHGTNLEELTAVCFVWAGISLVFYLLQGFIGSAIELELEDVDVVRSLYDAVHPSFALLLLGIDGVAAYHPHE